MTTFLDCCRRVELNESMADIQNMFLPLLKATTPSSQLDSSLKVCIRHVKSIAGAISYGGRGDILLWAARWHRLGICSPDPNDVPSFAQKKQAFFQKFAADFRKHGTELSDQEFAQIGTDITSKLTMKSLGKLRPYFDSTSEQYVANVSKIEFGWQTPDQIIQAVDDAIFQFDDANTRVIPADSLGENAKKLIDFGDGMSWWSLGLQSCDAEGTAMGHCGNNHSGSVWDNVLSLRKEMHTKAGKTAYTPYLTFIIDVFGFLTEMKGRANSKPGPQFYKYIIPLLQSDMVKGISIGGMETAGNFSIYDLPKDISDKLIAEKPKLVPLNDRVSKALKDKKPALALDDINEILTNYQLPPAQSIQDGFGGLVTLGSIKNDDMIPEFIRQNEHVPFTDQAQRNDFALLKAYNDKTFDFSVNDYLRAVDDYSYDVDELANYGLPNPEKFNNLFGTDAMKAVIENFDYFLVAVVTYLAHRYTLPEEFFDTISSDINYRILDDVFSDIARLSRITARKGDDNLTLYIKPAYIGDLIYSVRRYAPNIFSQEKLDSISSLNYDETNKYAPDDRRNSSDGRKLKLVIDRKSWIVGNAQTQIYSILPWKSYSQIPEVFIPWTIIAPNVLESSETIKIGYWWTGMWKHASKAMTFAMEKLAQHLNNNESYDHIKRMAGLE